MERTDAEMNRTEHAGGAHKINVMKATLKQEWKASRARILYTSAVIAIVLLGASLTNFIAYQTQSNHLTFFGVVMYIIGMISVLCIPLYALLRGCGNLRSLLFSDTNYLMLLVPAHSYTQLGAKQLVNLAEYVIYAVPAALYLSFMMPSLGVLLYTEFGTTFPNIDPGVSYWENVKAIYHFVFAEHLGSVLQFFVWSIISFVVWQAGINFAYALYSAFIHTKRPNKFLILVILFFVFYIPIRLGFFGLNYGFSSSFSDDGTVNGAAVFWNHAMRFAVFGAMYFLATGWLLEHKTEV